MERPDERLSATELSDAEILRRARGGDAAAFEALIARHGQALYGVALYLTGQASDAEDVLQETLLGAYEQLAKFEERASVKTWLTRILLNQAARLQRSRRVRRAVQAVNLSDPSRALLAATTTKSSVWASEVRMDVLSVLQTLSPEFREVIVLREFQGFSYQEIADALNIPAGTVESRLFRARQELKERLKDYLV